MGASRNICCISVEVFCFFGIIIVCAVVNEFIYLTPKGLQPFKRGFFCNDQSIQKPLRHVSVPFEIVIAFGVTITLILIGILECGNKWTNNKQYDTEEVEGWEDKKLGSVVIPSWIIRMLHRMAAFLFGIPLLFLVFNVVSLLTGHLRPNFLAICKPNMTLFNCSDGYITDDVCTGNPLAVKHARLSFPSVHTVVATYCMVFVALSLQAAECLRQLKLFRTVLQTAAVLAALSIGLSRVKDYYHHWGDIVAGFILGTVAAWLLAFKVTGLFDKNNGKQGLRSYSLMRMDNDEAEELPGKTVQ